MNGFLNLNKPFGLTSHDCVARVRRLLRLKRVGHGGTLDPTAIGVLPIAVGRATRLLQYLSHDKAYRATVRFGVRTATDDMAGEVLAADPCPQLTLPDVQKFLPQFLGQIQQIPPSYSAIQVGGKRLYDLARAGETVEAPVRTVEVFSIEVLDWRSGDYPELDVAIACGTGTYIRAIARDWGDCLGVGATLSALERTLSSGFDLPHSLTLETLTEQVELGTFESIAPELALQHIPPLTLTTEMAKRWCQGQKIEARLVEMPTRDDFSDLGVYRIRHEDESFLGIGEHILNGEDLLLIPKMVWVE